MIATVLTDAANLKTNAVKAPSEQHKNAPYPVQDLRYGARFQTIKGQGQIGPLGLNRLRLGLHHPQQAKHQQGG